MNQTKTIMIADDHPLMIEGLVAIIQQYTPFKIISTSPDGSAILHKMNSLLPDLLVLDLNMPKQNGLETAKLVKAKFPKVKIVCISMYSDKSIYDALEKIGVNGFIPKLTDAFVFTATLQRIMNGEDVFVRRDTGWTEKNELSEDSFQNVLKLSEREVEVIQLIKRGLTTKEIAEELKRSEYTIETHRKNICRKLNITSQNGLIKFIMENNL